MANSPKLIWWAWFLPLTHNMQSKELSREAKQVVLKSQKQSKSIFEITSAQLKNSEAALAEQCFHNIQPNEEHSPGGWHVIIQVYPEGTIEGQTTPKSQQ